MKLRTITGWLAALLAVLTIPTAMAAEPKAEAKPAYIITVTGMVEIAQDGTISKYQLDDSKTLPLVKTALDRNIQRWRFHPILVDGKAVRAKTAMKLDISAEPVASGDYQLLVNSATFGTPVYGKRQSVPVYPMQAAKSGLGARVLMLVKLSPEGRVEIAHARQVSLDHRTDNEVAANQWRKLFADASERAVKRWRFDAAPEFEGQPMPPSVLVPIVYKMRGTKDDQWQAFIPGPIKKADWADEPPATSGDEIADGEAVAVDSRFRLQDGVIGKLL